MQPVMALLFCVARRLALAQALLVLLQHGEVWNTLPHGLMCMRLFALVFLSHESRQKVISMLPQQTL